jgi:hypothetical protein
MAGFFVRREDQMSNEHPDVRKAEEGFWDSLEDMRVLAARLPKGHPRRDFLIQVAKALGEADFSEWDKFTPQELQRAKAIVGSVKRILSMRESGKITDEEMKVELRQLSQMLEEDTAL